METLVDQPERVGQEQLLTAVQVEHHQDYLAYTIRNCQKHGDKIDTHITALKSVSNGIDALITGVSAPFLGPVGLTATAGWLVKSLYQGRHNLLSETSSQALVPEAGLIIEVYREKPAAPTPPIDRPILLHVPEPIPEGSAAPSRAYRQSLFALGQIAEGVDFDNLALPASFLSKARLPHDSLPKTTSTNLFEEKRGARPTNDTLLVTFSRDEFTSYAQQHLDESEVSQESRLQLLSDLVNYFSQQNPRGLLAAVQSRDGRPTEENAPHLERGFKEIIDRCVERLNDTDMIRMPIDEHPSGKQKVHLRGQAVLQPDTDDLELVWLSEKSLPTSREILAEHLEDIDSFYSIDQLLAIKSPDKRLLSMAYIGWREAHNFEEALAEATTQTRFLPPATTAFDTADLKRRNVETRKSRRLLRVAAGLGMATVALFGIEKGAAVMSQILSHLPLPEAEYGLPPAANNQSGEAGLPNNSSESHPGGISNLSNITEVEWELADQGLDPNGYFVTSLYDSYSNNRWQLTGSATLENLTEPPSVPPAETNLIMVRTVMENAVTGNSIELPVRIGTEVAAIEVLDRKGRPLEYELHLDGDFTPRIVFTAPTQQAVTLRYWLQATDPFDPAIRARLPLSGENTQTRALSERATQLIVAGFSPDEAAATNPSFAAGEQRARYMASALSEEFLYAINPQVELSESPTQFVEHLTETGECNCGLCNSALALLLAQDSQLIYNYATGYINRSSHENSGGGFSEQTLQRGEAHGFVIDERGNSFDATPSRMSTDDPTQSYLRLMQEEPEGIDAQIAADLALTREVNSPTQSIPEASSENLIGGLVGLAAISSVVASRKDIVRFARKKRMSHLRRGLNKSGRLHESYALLELLAYGSTDDLGPVFVAPDLGNDEIFKKVHELTWTPGLSAKRYNPFRTDFAPHLAENRTDRRMPSSLRRQTRNLARYAFLSRLVSE